MRPLLLALFVAAHSVALVATALAGEGPALRRDPGFRFDSETVDGFWIEAAGGGSHSEVGSQIDVDTVGAALRAVWGFRYAEVGATVVGRWTRIDFPFGDDLEETGIGNSPLWAKGVWRTRDEDAFWRFAVGGGLSVVLPASEDVIGSKDTFLQPFATAGVHIGPLLVQGHAGYTSDIENSGDYDATFWGAGVHWAPIDWLALRAEVSGDHTVDAPFDDIDSVSIDPGLDFKLDAGASVDVLLRTTAEAGLTSDAPDWGIGAAIVVTFNPFSSMRK